MYLFSVALKQSMTDSNFKKNIFSIFVPIRDVSEKWCLVNPFPHVDVFWRLCSRRLFENIVTKEEIAQNVQFLLLPQCFPLLVIGYPFNYRDFLFFWQNMFKVVCCRIDVCGKGLIYEVFSLNLNWFILLRLDTSLHAQYLLPDKLSVLALLSWEQS